MKNNEIKEMCMIQQSKRGESYPKYKFSIKQTKRMIKIYWEYLDGSCWTIENYEGFYIVRNEHGEIMNDELEDTTTLEDAIKSSVYYMTSRY